MSKRKSASGRMPPNKRVCGEENKSVSDFAPSGQVLNVQNVLAHLKSLFPSEKFDGSLPPIVFQHQLYSLLPKRTTVDKELGDMRESCKIRLFKFGNEADTFMITFTDDYRSCIQHHCKELGVMSNLTDRFLSVISNCPDIYLSKQKFSDLCFDEKEITQLVKAGLLTIRDVGSWWLAIPNVGIFLKTFMLGRKSMLNTIKKSKFQEILQEELLGRPLPKGVKLCSAYHLHDLIGADLVHSVPSTSGPLLRLRE